MEKICTKVKFASVKAIEYFLKTKKGSGDMSPYFCHVCNAFHYTSSLSWQRKKIALLEDQVNLLTKQNEDFKSGKGVKSISNTKNMQLLYKILSKIDDDVEVRVKCALIKRLYRMIEGPYPKLKIAPPSESQDNEPDHEG
jgi:hypothetical protein